MTQSRVLRTSFLEVRDVSAFPDIESTRAYPGSWRGQGEEQRVFSISLKGKESREEAIPTGRKNVCKRARGWR